MAGNWTAEDEGLLAGIKLLDYVRYNDGLQPQLEKPPFTLGLGEEHIATTSARVSEWVSVRTRPEDWRFFRLRVKWAQDPLMAPFLWLLLLPFNIISFFISRAMATETRLQRKQVGQGFLTITQRALVQSTPSGSMRIPWAEINTVDLGSVPEIYVTSRGRRFVFVLPFESQMWFYVAFRYLAFKDRATKLPIPTAFLARARS